MGMHFSKTSESTSFVWRTIEMELNRLDMEVRWPFSRCCSSHSRSLTPTWHETIVFTQYTNTMNES
jgi:hypothetical protein